MPGPSGIGHRADVGLRKVAAHKEERFTFGLSQGVGGWTAASAPDAGCLENQHNGNRPVAPRQGRGCQSPTTLPSGPYPSISSAERRSNKGSADMRWANSRIRSTSLSARRREFWRPSSARTALRTAACFFRGIFFILWTIGAGHARPLLDQPAPYRKPHQFADAVQVQLFQDAAAVRLHGVHTEVQHTGDFLVGLAFGQQL
jgi:hypothetical protein